MYNMKRLKVNGREASHSCQEVSLHNGDKVEFHNGFEFKVIKENYEVCASSIEIYGQMKSVMQRLGINFKKEWSENATHLIVETIELDEKSKTKKLNCALANGCHIITPAYFKQLYKVVERFGNDLPQQSMYLPTFLSKEIHGYERLLLADQGRRKLYYGFTFVTFDKEQHDLFQEVIEAANGIIVLLEVYNKRTMNALYKDDIVIFEGRNEGTQKDESNRWKIDLQRELIRRGIKVMSESAITLSLLFNSVEKFCKVNDEPVEDDIDLSAVAGVNEQMKGFGITKTFVEYDTKTISYMKKREIAQKTQNVLFSHETKIHTVNEKLLSLKADGKKAMSRDEMNTYLEIMEAENLILKELECQKEEFENYVNMIVELFESIDLNSKICQDEMNKMVSDFELEYKRFESSLPIYSKKSEIVNTVLRNQVTILTAETGSGKSTQVVQYLYQQQNEGLIVCTQPRKVAAISLAKRVSEEMNSRVGEIVGYCVGAQVKKSKETSILFMTDQLLLNEVLMDPLLTKYKYIIVDEAHERSISTDLLVAMVKKALLRRPELRLIISSATIDPKIFQEYFRNIATRLHVHGRTFPVQVIYEHVSIGMDYLQISVAKVKQIHKTEESGDVLVFLTTPAETERAQEFINADSTIAAEIKCLVLHGRLPPEEQQLVFEPTPEGMRKVVFATNSAETSITIPNIRYVIDSGMVKEKHYDRDKNASLLRVAPVNKSSAVQRMGRAGRTQEGKCFRLYTVDEYNEMVDEMLPEILRENLGLALLKLYQLGVEDPLQYDFVQPPLITSLVGAQEELYDLHALKDNKLTRYGELMATLAIEPKLGKFVSLAIDEGIPLDAMVVAAVCSVGGNIFFRAGTEDDKQAADRLKTRFCDEAGDLITMLKIYHEWNEVEERQKSRWCVFNSMNAKTLRFARDMVNDMKKNAELLLGITINDSFSDINIIKETLPALLSRCFFKNIAYFSGHERGGYYRPGWGNERFHLHPSSALSFLSMNPKWLLFSEVLTTSRTYLINVTVLPDCLGETLFRRIKTASINLVKTWIVGKSTAKSLGFGRWNCKQEKEMQENISPDIYIDFDPNIGEVSLHCARHCTQEGIEELNQRILKEREWLDRKVLDVPLSNGNPTSVVLEKGGNCIEILEQGDFNAVLLQKVDGAVTKDQIEKAFQEFGTISEIIQFKSGNFTWGKIGFKKSFQAFQAFKLYKKNDNDFFQDMIVKPAMRQGDYGSQLNNYVVKATWTRRRAKGNFAFITIEDPNVYSEFVSKQKLVGNNVFKFCRSQQPSSLKLIGINPNSSQHEVITMIENQFPHVKISKCVIPRFEKEIESKDAIEQMQRQLSMNVGRYLRQEDNRHRSFRIEMNPVKSSRDVDYEARIIFKNARHSDQIVTSNLMVGNASVRFNVELRSPPVTVSKVLYHLIKEDLHKEMQGMVHVNMEVKELDKKKNKNIEIIVEAKDVEQLSKARKVMNDHVFGENVKFAERQFRYFFTPNGREFIDLLRMQKSCIINIERRLLSIVLFGTNDVRRYLVHKINDKKALIKTDEEEWILNLHDQPNGFIKVLIKKYGVDFKTLYEETSVSYININFLCHTLEFTGPNESLIKSKEIMEKLAIEQERIQRRNVPNCNECPVCFDDLETTSYQLEICTHSYCKECIAGMCQHAVRNKDLPLSCAKDGCDQLISIQDIIEFTEIKDLVPGAVEVFVARNKEKYKYCVTPNCLNIYSVSDYPDPEPYHCAMCQVLICTYCHIEYHNNIQCQINARKLDKSLKEWLSEPGKDRGICPRCSAPIERADGCNHITCLSCKNHVCWRCKRAVFTTSAECYDHLGKCGGIFD